MALATLAVACVVIGPAPRLLDSFERTYVVALEEHRQRSLPRPRRVPFHTPRPWRPRGLRPHHPRP